MNMLMFIIIMIIMTLQYNPLIFRIYPVFLHWACNSFAMLRFTPRHGIATLVLVFVGCWQRPFTQLRRLGKAWWIYGCGDVTHHEGPKRRWKERYGSFPNEFPGVQLSIYVFEGCCRIAWFCQVRIGKTRGGTRNYINHNARARTWTFIDTCSH